MVEATTMTVVMRELVVHRRGVCGGVTKRLQFLGIAVEKQHIELAALRRWLETSMTQAIGSDEVLASGVDASNLPGLRKMVRRDRLADCNRVAGAGVSNLPDWAELGRRFT